MKAVIFAGGAGTRLWPLSRKKTPKQFEKIIGDKSTLESAIDRIKTCFPWHDIYIATNSVFSPLISKYFPEIPPENIISEPELRDVGPAVGLATAILNKTVPDEPMLILWSDHLIKKVDKFNRIIQACAKSIERNKKRIVFISQKPRFASQNLGWIEYGEASEKTGGLTFYRFRSFHYRPSSHTAASYMRKGNCSWNLGYFVATPSFLWSLFKKFQPVMHSILTDIVSKYGSGDFEKHLNQNYMKLPKISFDDAVLEKILPGQALVVSEDFGWSDIGAWESLKEALQKYPDENIVKGKALLTDCKDVLMYNFTPQMTVCIDLQNMIVINTKDALLICPKNSVPKIKKTVEYLSASKDSHLT